MPSDSKSRPRLVDRIREQVFDLIERECAEASDECDGPLQVDHPHGRTWTPRKLSSYNRWLRYLKEARANEVRALCSFHNNSIRPRPMAYDASQQPF